MQVNSVNNYNKNQISFGSKRILPVIVKDMNNKPVKAWFSRIQLSDDKDAMKRVYSDWYHQQRNKYSDSIYYDFLDKKPVYALELDGNENLYERLLCLANIRKKGEKFRLDRIQASPSSSHDSPITERKYKFVGTTLIYELVRIAQKAKMQRFEVDSRCDAFFNFLGMKQRGIFKTFNQKEMLEFIRKQKNANKSLQ